MSLVDAYNLFNYGKLDESRNSIAKLIHTLEGDSEEYCELKLLECEILVLEEKFSQALDELESLIENSLIRKKEICYLKILLLKSSILNHLSRIKESYILFQEVELRSEKIIDNFNDINYQKLLMRLWRDKGSFLQFYGKHEEAENAFTKSLEIAEGAEDLIEICTTLNSFGIFKLNTDELEIAETYLNKSHNIRLELKNEYLLVRSYNCLGMVYQVKGELDQSLGHFQKAMEISEKLNLKDSMVILYNSFGLIAHSEGNTSKAIEFHKKGLKINEELGIKSNFSISYNNIGLVYLTQGDLDKALKYQQMSLQFGKGVFDEVKYVASYNNIGIIFSQKGELGKALHNHYKYLQMAEKYNIKTDMATAYVNIGLIHQIKGEYEIANDYFHKCLAIDREIGNEIDLAESLYNIVILNLERALNETAYKFLSELIEINKHVNNKIVDLRARLAKAIYDKHTNRFIARAKAQEMLMQISDEEVIDHELTIYAKMNLCELLLNELKTTGNKIVLSEIKEIVDNLHSIAEEQVSHKLKAENYLLQANLALIESDYTKSFDLLQKGDEIARENGLTSLSMKYSEQFDNLLERKEVLEQLVEKEVSIQDRLKEIGVEDLITKLIKPEDLTIKQEKPAYFFILTKGGVTIYSRNFQAVELKNELMGGLLTAIYTMSEDVFLGEKSVQRIKHNDYSVIIKPERDLLFSYVFTGASYNALEKLEKIINMLSESELIWNALTRKVPRITILERDGLDLILNDAIINLNN